MKGWRRVLVGVTVFVFAIAALVWWMPARLAWPCMQSRFHGLQLEQLDGTLWQGRAGRATMAGQDLGSVAWTLSRRALLGDVRITLDVRQRQLQWQGTLHRLSSTQDDLQDVVLRMDMAMLGTPLLLHAQPQGQLDAQIAQARLQGMWPMQVDATGTWSHAAMRTADGVIALGTLRMAINGQAGVLQASLDDDGSGALQTAGRLSFSPLGWDLRMHLKPRRHDPALLRWLHTLGTPAADGTLELRYRGGLAQLNSTGNP